MTTLRVVTDAESKSCWVWCPGCQHLHIFTTWRSQPEAGPVWGWDEDVTNPTFDPSMMVAWSEEQRTLRCHSYLRSGQWQFLMDSTHDLAGQVVAMVPLPTAYETQPEPDPQVDVPIQEEGG